MIVEDYHNMPTPQVPQSNFRQWLYKRRFSAELKKKRVRNYESARGGPQPLSTQVQRARSDMTWVKDVEIESPKGMGRRHSNENKKPTAFGQMKKAIAAMPGFSARRPGDDVLPLETLSPKSVSVALPPELTESMTTQTTEELKSPTQSVENLDANGEPLARHPSSEKQESILSATEPEFDDTDNETSRNTKANSATEPSAEADTGAGSGALEAEGRTSVAVEGEQEAQSDQPASVLRSESQQGALGGAQEGKKRKVVKRVSIGEMAKPVRDKPVPSPSAATAARELHRAPSSAMVNTKKREARRLSVGNSPRRDHVKRWANKQLHMMARLGRFLHGFQESDHYSYITHVYSPAKPDIHQNMDLPLSHYFISSGHNSFLTGNQVTSRCSPNPIANALKHGCRVIELDIWNDKKGPKVVHGFTMTKPVGFAKCIKVVRKYAFAATDMPLIITLENHCNEKNRKIVMEILNEELGDMIYWTKTGRKSSVKWNNFPSPKSLRGRILIRDKDDSPVEDAILSDDEQEPRTHYSLANAPVGSSAMSTMSGDSAHPKFAAHSFKLGGLFGGTQFTREEGSDPKGLLDVISIINVKHAIVSQLGYAASFSRSEATLADMNQNVEEFRGLTKKHLLRVYPHARRIDSSNYDPYQAWLVGAQLVAMNWQTPGIPMWVYRGMFLNNGSCGYIQKPEWMMGDDFVDVSSFPVTQMLSVQVLSARHIGHRSVKENYVQVDLYGIPRDTESKRTHVVKGMDACTFDDVMHFPLRCQELAVLLVMLRCKDVVTGHVAIPLASLCQGINVFPLLNKDSKLHVSRSDVALVMDIQLRPATGNLRKLLEGEK